MEKLTLSTCQENARKEFKRFLAGDDQFFILTGGPGMGKSFVTKVLIEDIRAQLGEVEIHATATTNKAARVVSGFIDYPANTIHSLLGLRVRNNPNTGRQDLIRRPDAQIIHNAIILLDESSMVDDPLLDKLVEGTHNCRFLLIGDKDQLAPIGQSRPPVFEKGYTQCELNTAMRFGGAIGALAAQLKETVRTGIFKPIIPNDKEIIHLSGTEFQMMVDSKFAEEHRTDYHKVICWKNDSVRAYNDYIRSLHYDEEHFVVGEIVVTNQPITARDGTNASKTMYSTDEYATIVEYFGDVQHGVTGYWYKLDRGCAVFQATDQKEVKSKLKQLAQTAKSGGGWHNYFAAKEFFSDLRAVHACTTYKSQGSSYHGVFIDLGDIGDCREWESVARQIYVAVTRAKHRVYLYGSLPPQYTEWDHIKSPFVYGYGG